MSDFDQFISRSTADALIPEEVSKEIVQGVPEASSAMKLFRRLPNMSRKQRRIPVLDILPVAYFLNGETGTGSLKKTTKMAWADKFLNVEEIAAIVPIPENVLDDANYDIGGQAKPFIIMAIGRAFDGAVFFGVNKPTSWPTDIVAAATAAGNAVTLGTGAQQEITTNITNPPAPRNITATAGGTAGDIKAIQVTVEGTDMLDEAIREVLPAFTVDIAGTVVGAKAFKTLTKATIPAHSGTGATTAIGFGDKLGLPYKRATIPCIAAYLGNTIESTAPTIVADASDIEKNTIDLNSALNGSKVDAYVGV